MQVGISIALLSALCNNIAMYIFPFTSTEATLEAAGGKGANLARLTRAGFPVPRGFIISTDAYREFVNTNRWLGTIQSVVENLSAEDVSALEKASSQIRTAFIVGKMPGHIDSVIRAAYAEFDGKPVAVRSSATAEDLPDLSFAGQQDTYLNIIGLDRLVEAVIQCWSSLWTARAIGYRIRNGIGHHEAALAVVVQEMVQSEASGVLFTANPLTGLRSESVIDATFGLGEALVSGQVEPDHYVVDTLNHQIISKTLGAKRISTRSKEGGGVQVIEENAEQTQALSDDDIRHLVWIGGQIQKEYGFPQDIEWALAQGQTFILQSRPITSLFPLPKESFDPLIVWFSLGAFQGVLSAITPLGRDMLRMLVGRAARMFGPQVRYDETEALVPAGERLWIRISDVMRHPLGRRLYRILLRFGEPSVRQILLGLENEERIAAGQGHLKLSTMRALLGFALPILPRAARTVHDPEKTRADFTAYVESQLVHPAITGEDKFTRLAQRLQFMQEHAAAGLYQMFPRFLPILGPALASLALLTRITRNESDASTDHGFASNVLEITRGLPNNVTTEMDLALWRMANAIRTDSASLKIFLVSDASTLSARYLNGTLPETAQQALTNFMTQYGMRGVGEIDLGQLRWREDPTSIMQTLLSYLQITPDMAPDILFQRGAKAAEETIEKLAIAVRGQPAGGLKERIVRGAARRIRTLMGLREAPKFFIVRMLGIVRSELLASGEEFAREGIIARAEDLFFLHFSELQELVNNGKRNWKAIIAERRSNCERENRRNQIPRVLVSDGRAFYEGIGVLADTDKVISGSPVSPGVAEGVVRVIFDPRRSQLAPGEILVCPGTDPAWTPLFMAAGGLVTEVGGMMTHGSVVAREYGIPAVVGVHRATTRLRDGQRVRIDGTAGKIIVLE